MVALLQDFKSVCASVFQRLGVFYFPVVNICSLFQLLSLEKLPIQCIDPLCIFELEVLLIPPLLLDHLFILHGLV